jgi:hypothetical protein
MSHPNKNTFNANNVRAKKSQMMGVILFNSASSQTLSLPSITEKTLGAATIKGIDKHMITPVIIRGSVERGGIFMLSAKSQTK